MNGFIVGMTIGMLLCFLNFYILPVLLNKQYPETQSEPDHFSALMLSAVMLFNFLVSGLLYIFSSYRKDIFWQFHLSVGILSFIVWFVIAIFAYRRWSALKTKQQASSESPT